MKEGDIFLYAAGTYMQAAVYSRRTPARVYFWYLTPMGVDFPLEGFVQRPTRDPIEARVYPIPFEVLKDDDKERINKVLATLKTHKKVVKHKEYGINVRLPSTNSPSLIDQFVEEELKIQVTPGNPLLE